jgi:hypothetical protein
MSSRTVVQMGDPLQKERTATAVAILPGYLIEQVPGAETVRAHSTAGGRANIAVAIENSNAGGEVTTAYAVSSKIQYVTPRSGDEILMMIQASENIAIGDWLESAGDGALRELVEVDKGASASGNIQGENIIGRALEATNVGTDALIRVEIQ